MQGSQGLQEYSVEHLSPTQTAMLEDLRDYGIIWQRKVGHIRFALSSDAKAGLTSSVT